MRNKYSKMVNYSNIFKPTNKNLVKCANILKKNGLVALPTETVYGLAGNACSTIAVNKIYKIKKRPRKNPLIIHFDSLTSLKKETITNKYLDKLYKRFSPGPITYVLKIKPSSKISKVLLSQDGTIACRVPANVHFRKIIKLVGSPLAAPSANISNNVSPTSALDVYEEFKNKIAFILDGKKSNIGIESSVINLIEKPKILRPGKISISDIKKILKNVTKNNSKKILSPGQMKLHYSPGIPIYLDQKKFKKGGALLVFGKSKYKASNIFYLSKSESLDEAAKNLYSKFREIKNKGYKNISINSIPKYGIGIAINDRLKRASS